jgi:hypothetical protein
VLARAPRLPGSVQISALSFLEHLVLSALTIFLTTYSMAIMDCTGVHLDTVWDGAKIMLFTDAQILSIHLVIRVIRIVIVIPLLTGANILLNSNAMTSGIISVVGKVFCRGIVQPTYQKTVLCLFNKISIFGYILPCYTECLSVFLLLPMIHATLLAAGGIMWMTVLKEIIQVLISNVTLSTRVSQENVVLMNCFIVPLGILKIHH